MHPLLREEAAWSNPRVGGNCFPALLGVSMALLAHEGFLDVEFEGQGCRARSVQPLEVLLLPGQAQLPLLQLTASVFSINYIFFPVKFPEFQLIKTLFPFIPELCIPPAPTKSAVPHPDGAVLGEGLGGPQKQLPHG